MMKHPHSITALLFLALLLLAGCAKEGYPTGGPKDETPPVVLSAIPQNGTTQFDSKEFLIQFDEYVQVRDADNNIIVSPPMKHKPEYSTKGRGILVKIKDTLNANTTYLFQFKEGIADFNEGNPLASYEYVFSTGAVIDSMTLRGRVLDAFTAKPYNQPVTVVAFADQQLLVDSAICDSVVAKEKPLYMTRCDKEGFFQLNYLRNGRYRVLALNDENKDLMLSTDEAVAFLDSLVSPSHLPAPPDTVTADTTATDSAHLDSTRIDSTQVATVDTIPQLAMRISQFKQERQRVTKAEFTSKGHILITTQCPLSPSFTLRPLDSTDTSVLYIRPNRKCDTLTLWTQQSTCDSLTLVLADTNLTDTLRLQFKAKSGGQRGLTAFMNSLVASTHPYFDTLRIAFTDPVTALPDSLADSLVTVFNLTDSTTSRCGIQFYDSCASGTYTRAMLLFHGHGGEKYRFTIPKNSLTNIYSKSNADSLVVTTQFDKAENYGCIHLTVDLDSALAPVLLQLTNEKGDVLRQVTLTADQKVIFDHLKGSKYNIRAIVDTDNNGQWTPGDYWLHRQPEQVIYFDKTLELRENWDMEERWELRVKN